LENRDLTILRKTPRCQSHDASTKLTTTYDLRRDGRPRHFADGVLEFAVCARVFARAPRLPRKARADQSTSLSSSVSSCGSSFGNRADNDPWWTTGTIPTADIRLVSKLGEGATSEVWCQTAKSTFQIISPHIPCCKPNTLAIAAQARASFDSIPSLRDTGISWCVGEGSALFSKSHQ
jgi:hypothetical protein